MRRNSFRTLIAAGAALPMLMAAVPAEALDIQLINLGGANARSQAGIGFRAAADFWEQMLGDSIRIKLEVGFDSLGPDILGQTGSASSPVFTQRVYSALGTDQTTAKDAKAVANLSPLSTVTSGDFAGLQQLSVRVNQTTELNTVPIVGVQLYSDKRTRLDQDGSANNVALSVNSANLKALGIWNDANGDRVATIDGQIIFNSDLPFDFDPTDGITAGTSDFIAVAIHEIGHALGFVSGVDIYDYYTVNLRASGTDAPGILDDYAIGSVLDLFRYNYKNELDWSTSPLRKFFSFNGGDPYQHAQFSTGVENGDGWQASHWKAPVNGAGDNVCSPFFGIMNPYLCGGQAGLVTSVDLTAMDVIGWDLNQSPTLKLSLAAAVPEPATWLQMIAGFGLLGGVMRRARRAKARIAIA